jgi:adenosylmethionine-8-amino-7-oxononanoate aminotransferase
MTQKLTDAMLERGVYTRVAMDCICVAPPLVTTDAQLDQIVDTIRDAVTHVVGAAKKVRSVPAPS